MTKHQAIQHIRDILRIFKNTDPYLVINVLGTNGTPVKRVLEIPHGTVESFQHHCAVFSEESKNLKVSTIREGNYIIITRNITSKSVVPRVRIKVPYKPSIDSATGVSDGSVKNNIGSYGWVLESDYRKITGGGLVPQSHNEMDSQRAELYGIMNLVESVIRRFQPT